MEYRQWSQWLLDIQRWFFQSSYDELAQLLGRNGPENRWETQGNFSLCRSLCLLKLSVLVKPNTENHVKSSQRSRHTSTERYQI